MQVTIKPSDVYYRVTKEQIAQFLKENNRRIVRFGLVKPGDKILQVVKKYNSSAYAKPYVLIENLASDVATCGYFRYILEPIDPYGETVLGWE